MIYDNACTLSRNLKEMDRVESVIKVNNSLFHVKSYYDSRGNLQDALLSIARERLNNGVFSDKDNDGEQKLLYNGRGS